METHQDSTLCGLQRWFVHNFEKLGWIVLSNNKIKNDETYSKKVNAYSASVNKLLNDVNERAKNSRGNKTVKTDFTTMVKNLEKLKSYLLKMSIFEPLDSEGVNLTINDMSLQWMRHYYKHCFEKFGWMVLVKGNIDVGEYSNKPDLELYMKSKLDNYSRSIEVLLQSMKYRISKSVEVDLDAENIKHDIMIMHKNLCILNAATQSLLKKNIMNVREILGGGYKNNTILSSLFLNS